MRQCRGFTGRAFTGLQDGWCGPSEISAFVSGFDGENAKLLTAEFAENIRRGRGELW
jgi:hypothetical protein